MSRSTATTLARSLGVWLLVSSAAVAGCLLAWAPNYEAIAPDADPAQFAHVLVALCSATLLLALAWLWLVTTVTVVELMTGSVRNTGGVTRRLVLVACGAAVLAGTALPATAAGSDGASVLSGLPLPDRSVATSAVHERPHPQPTTTPTAGWRVHIVRAGESLWSIAASQRAGNNTDVNDLWRAIWSANRDVIGADPDLILPGQQLRLPTPPSDEGAR